MIDVKIFKKDSKKHIKHMGFTDPQAAIDFAQIYVGTGTAIDVDEINNCKSLGVSDKGHYAQFKRV